MTFGELRPGDLIIYYKEDYTLEMEMILGVTTIDEVYINTVWMRLVGSPYQCNEGLSMIADVQARRVDNISMIFTIVRDGHEIA